MLKVVSLLFAVLFVLCGCTCLGVKWISLLFVYMCMGISVLMYGKSLLLYGYIFTVVWVYLYFCLGISLLLYGYIFAFVWVYLCFCVGISSGMISSSLFCLYTLSVLLHILQQFLFWYEFGGYLLCVSGCNVRMRGVASEPFNWHSISL